MSVRTVRNLITFVASLAATVALAAEEGGHAAHAAEHHAPSITELLFPAINFALFMVIIVKYAIPAMREYLHRRHEEVSTAAHDAAAALAEAERGVTTVRGRLASIAAEREAITQDLVAIATTHADRARLHAEEAGQRRVRDASVLAEQERRRALAEVRAEMATRATSLAEARIRGALSPDDQAAFVRSFLQDAPAR
jgi:F0F1-type ATP synthase membrane subunit b/b'